MGAATLAEGASSSELSVGSEPSALAPARAIAAHIKAVHELRGGLAEERPLKEQPKVRPIRVLSPVGLAIPAGEALNQGAQPSRLCIAYLHLLESLGTQPWKTPRKGSRAPRRVHGS